MQLIIDKARKQLKIFASMMNPSIKKIVLGSYLLLPHKSARKDREAKMLGGERRVTRPIPFINGHNKLCTGQKI